MFELKFLVSLGFMLLLLLLSSIHPILSLLVDHPLIHGDGNYDAADTLHLPPSRLSEPEEIVSNPSRASSPPRTHRPSRGQVAVIDGVIGGGHLLDSEIITTPSSSFTSSRDPGHDEHHHPILNLIQSNPAATEHDHPPQPIHLFQSSNLTIHPIDSSSLPCPATRPSSSQLTGYIHLGNQPSDGALFFWFFQARNNPDQAPLILWLNGGPGSSSMIGLFQENGPCRIKLDSSGFDPNPEAWNQNANLIYIDQPIGTGYSYGTRSTNTTAKAVIDLYDALQILLSDSRFQSFIGRPFGVWTESYGGHFGPVLVDYILQMNLQIAQNNQTGNVVIPINSLGIGNGLINPLVQYPSYITYARSNPYNQTLVPPDVIETANNDFLRPSTGCRDLIKACQSNLRLVDCRTAQEFCNRKLLSALIGDRDVYDVRQPESNQYPPDFASIINNPKFKASIGVPPSVNWTESNEKIYLDFFATGDWMLDSSRELERVINAGIRTLIYAGDADFIVNYQGVEALVTSLNTNFSNSINIQNLSNWVVDGELAGVYKTSESFSYLRVFEAGHEVPAYGKGKLGIGRAAKVFFDQTIFNQPISSVNPDGSDPSNNSQGRSTPNRAKTNDGHHLNDPWSSYSYFLHPLPLTLLILLLPF